MVARRRGLAPLAVALTLAATGLATAGAFAATVVRGSSGPLTATLAPSTHTPKINKNWPITVTATLSGKAAHATAAYEFLFAGVQVGPTQYPGNNKRFSFTGHFSDNLVFPAASVGQPLTLRVVIKASRHTVNLNWAITPHK
ncbi:MAG TPA: hypothetical protein VN740_01010 [Solirubrobacteraceae bacterium]|nr:hypothetical protein [Solirubrobacteraceae bacterium]